ncbi:hypothetical protein Bbelb_378480 [Branchiostoma belcheri]|nr:hypothetical protein Bbelb_378480 [Branchiostoma belcheri]
MTETLKRLTNYGRGDSPLLGSGQSAGRGTVPDGDRVRWRPGAARPVGGRRDEPTPKVSCAMPMPTPGLQKEFTGKLRQVHPEMQTIAGIHDAKLWKDRGRRYQRLRP